ncbi:hypothetical protein AARAC_010519 [Aspergillus arachidicola]|uniref:Protein kinase domain-containing protein n=1 Tax=Aspergillus arachidicola TaxID=656916 RepID=A0A2G7FP02_9EURO|nr:hypothetical protein AARAC_010519 [Aspergillus arachidicola]
MSGKRKTLLPKTLHLIHEQGLQVSPTKGISSFTEKPGTHLAASSNTTPQKSPGKLLERDTELQKCTCKIDKYYTIDQAGLGVLALKDVHHLPFCVIKKYPRSSKKHIRNLKPARHKNLICLFEYAEAQSEIHLVYEYEHIPISLGCLAGSVQFSEVAIATVSREVLEGLQYIHSELRMSHGAINPSNILLTWKGEVKIANIGDSMLNGRTLRDRDLDLKAVGSMVIGLNDRALLVGSETPDTITTGSNLSVSAKEFIDNTKCKSIGELLKDDFLQLATPEGAWNLKPYYLEALPFGFRVGCRVHD